MSDPLLPEPDDQREEGTGDRVAEVEHEDADLENDVLDEEEDDVEDDPHDDPSSPSVLPRPAAGDRLTVAELDADLGD